MEEKKSQIGLYIAIIALLVGVANIFLGVLPTVEHKGQIQNLESRVTKAEKTADRAWQWVKERKQMGSMAPTPAPAPTPPLPTK
jgi:hypothetical protein